MKIGFIGLGIMGRPMALNLKKAGHALIVPERASLKDDIRAAAEVVADARAVAAQAEVLILMVPDTPDVEAALFGPDGAAEGLRRGTLVIDMSSISPIATKDFAKRVNAKGCDYLDAPVSGGEVGAEQGGAHDHGRRSGGGVRPRQAPVRGDGQDHHPCRRGERRRPDLQGRQPDHRRAEHPGGGRGAGVRRQGRAPTPPRCARRSAAASPPPACWSCTASG